MAEEDDILDSLLAIASEQLDQLEDNENNKATSVHNVIVDSTIKLKPKKTVLKETDIFQLESNLKPLPKAANKKPSSLIHNGDTDSSDDEGNRNYEDVKYNECGRDIKKLLNPDDCAGSVSTGHYGFPKKRISNWKTNPNTTGNSSTNIGSTFKSALGSKNKDNASKDKQKYQDVLLDPIFSMRIVNPKVSSAMLSERMQGRLAVRFSDLARLIFAGSLKDKDWVICGVVVNKSPPKTSQKGSQFSVLTLCDLKDDFKTVALFLFSSAYKDLGKTVVGTVIGVLNPSIMDRRDGCKDEASLSVDTDKKVMIFGQSKDFGTCKSLKKNGEKCTAIVNLGQCEFCIFHIKQEYQKCSKRSELQANFAGQGLVNLRNKVLGKNEVFYAGKSYTALPAKKSRKLQAKDNSIMESLSGLNNNFNNIVKAKNVTNKKKRGMARQLDINPDQKAKDLELLKKLGGSANLESKINFSGTRSDEISLENSKATALSVISKLKAKNENPENPITNKNSQYDLRGDLFVNVESKRSFSGKVSEDISLEDSKNTALSVISKLKAKKIESKCSDRKNPENIDETEALMTLDEFEAEVNFDDELNYSDEDEDEDNASSKIDKSFSHAVQKIGTPSSSKASKSDEKSAPKILKPDTPKSSSNLLNSIGKKTPSSSKEAKPVETSAKPETPKSSSKLLNSVGKHTPKLPENRTSNEKESARTLFSPPKSQIKKPVFDDSPTTTRNVMSPKMSQTSINGGLQKNNSRTLVNNSSSNVNNRQNMNSNIQSLATVTKNSLDHLVMGVPLLSGFGKDFVDLSKPITSRHVDRAKMNAVKFIQRNGPIKKIDPNNIRGSADKKRKIDAMLGGDTSKSDTPLFNGAVKKSKLQESEFISDRFKKMMAMNSRHTDLLEQHDDEEKDKYFNKLEVKEKMEEKMTNTHKLKCKAVKCLTCKYTSFSASDLCKSERHPLKVFDAMKRFYKCSNCQNRTVTLELIPTRPCTNCGGMKWEKTGMMKEKIAVVQHKLSIRGGEQTFMNSVAADANLDLMVPDD